MRTTLYCAGLFLAAGLVAGHAGLAGHADYTDHGDSWGPECTSATLRRQSPIVLPDEIYEGLIDQAASATTKTVNHTTTKNPKGALKLVTLAADIEIQGDALKNLEMLKTEDLELTLDSLHFHARGEHVYRNRQGEITRDGVEGHFVFADSAGEPRAVFGVMFRETATSRSPLLDYMFPEDKADQQEYELAVPKNGLFNMLWQRQDDGEHIRDIWAHYPGSLTTPDCTEGIDWFVSTVPATKEQIQRFDVIRLGQNNDGEGSYRNPQPLNDRVVDLVWVHTQKAAAPQLFFGLAATLALALGLAY